MTIESLAPEAPARSTASLGDHLLRLGRRMLRLWQYRRATRKLEGLDDRALSDLGIGRADITRVVHHGRPPPRYYL